MHIFSLIISSQIYRNSFKLGGKEATHGSFLGSKHYDAGMVKTESPDLSKGV